jgi:putative transposase
VTLTIGRYGKPRKLRSDNEAVFNSWVFKTFLKLVGIQKQTTNVHSPWQNGRIERLFGTLKPIIRQLHISGKAQLQTALDEFKTFYNHARPHTNLNNQTPAQVWQNQCRNTKPKRARKSKTEPAIVQAFDGLMTGIYEPPD